MKTFEVLNTIDDTKEICLGVDEVKEFISSELEQWNCYEAKEPYTEEDFIVTELN